MKRMSSFFVSVFILFLSINLYLFFMILIKLIRKKKTSTDFMTREVVFYSFLYFPALQKSSSFVLVQTETLYILLLLHGKLLSNPTKTSQHY